MGKSYKKWTNSLFRVSQSSLPFIYGIHLTNSLIVGDIFEYGKQLQGWEGRHYQTLYVYKFAYDEYLIRCDAMGMTECIVGMSETLRYCNILPSTKKYIVRKFQQTSEDAMTRIGEFPLSNDLKVKNKVRCLAAIGIQHHELGEYEPAIMKYDQCIRMMNTMQHPQQYHGYGAVLLNSGVTYYYLQRFDDALQHLNAALSAMKEATDIASELFRDDQIRTTEAWIQNIEVMLGSMYTQHN